MASRWWRKGSSTPTRSELAARRTGSRTDPEKRAPKRQLSQRTCPKCHSCHKASHRLVKDNKRVAATAPVGTNELSQINRCPKPACETRPARSESRRFNAHGRVRRELVSWNSYLIVGVISAGRRVTSYGNTIYSDRAACRNGSPLSAYSPKAAR